MSKVINIFSVMMLLFLLIIFTFNSVIAGTYSNKDKSVNIKKALEIHIPFIANEGQINNRDIRFYANTFGGTVYVTRSGEIIYSLPKLEQKGGDEVKGKQLEQKSMRGVVLSEELGGKNVKVEVKGDERAVTKVSYFRGNNPSKWRKNIPTYNTLSLGEIYKGIELKLRAHGKKVEKLFYVKPHANPEDITVKIEGAKGVWVNGKGELEIETEVGIVTFTKPMAYQQINGKKVGVTCDYNLKNAEPKTANSELIYSFNVGEYDKTMELVIDPLLSSTFLGKSQMDNVHSIAISPDGNVYVTGYTNSADFPTTPGAYDTSYTYYDGFISKLDGDLTTLLASTFLGGWGFDPVYSLAIDPDGNVYVAGSTNDGNFPTTPGAYDTSHNGGSDGFISKLDGDLTTLLASTFLGGGEPEPHDYICSLAIGSGGNIYVGGQTHSSSFPTTSGAYDISFNSTRPYSDAFISKLNGDLTTLLASTFLGGSASEGTHSIATDSSGNVYVAGWTYSSDFPSTPGAYDTSSDAGGWADTFVSKFNGDLTSLVASTFLGGSLEESSPSVLLDLSGNIYVSGFTYSPDFPTTQGAYDMYFNGNTDVVVSKLNGDLTSLLASTFLGGSNIDYINPLHLYSGFGTFKPMAIDTGGNIYVAGVTESTDFPTTPDAYDTSFNGQSDAFVSKFNGDLTTLLASTFLGGSSNDYANSIAMSLGGDIYVAGYTESTDFPTTPAAYDISYDGNEDAFISKFDSNLSGNLSTLTLLSPNGGTVIPSGWTYTIRWWAPPEAVKFDIGYSLGDGLPGTWILIAKDVTGSNYNWTVPAPDGNKGTCRVGVRGYNASGGVIGTDISDNPFTIEVVKLTYPNGGDLLIEGITYTITWRTNSTIRPVQSVRIYGSPNEGQPGTWRLLTTVSGNPGYYDWIVPSVGTTKDKCRLGVRLLDSMSIPIGQDAGDGNFTIFGW